MTGPARAAIILAAGVSRRMGRSKADLPSNPFGPGPTFFERVLDRLRETVDLTAITAVVGPDGPHPPTPALRIVNPEPGRGMLRSVQLGLRALLERAGDARGILVWPVDHPLVRADTLRALWDHAERGPGTSVIPVCGGRLGHPVVLGRRACARVLAAGADGRLDRLLAEDLASHLGVDDLGVLRNINTLERYGWFFGPLPGRGRA